MEGAIKRKHILEIFIILSLFLVFTGKVWAEEGMEPAYITPKKLNLLTGKSVVIEVQSPVKRVSIAMPEIADAMVLSPQQIYLSGKSAGVTSLTLWNTADKAFAVFDLEVSPDTTRLKEKLHEMLPEEDNIRVSTSNNKVVLSGTISSTSKMPQVIAIAQPYAPCPSAGDQKPGTQINIATEEQGKSKEECTNIINLLSVEGVQQVMLEVRVSEIQRTLLQRLGVNFGYVTSTGKMGLSLLNNLTFPQHLPGGSGNSFNPGTINPTTEPGTVLSQNINGVLRFMSDDTTWTVFIDALKENGLLKVLAEPTLMTLSGKTANFLAGGEFPIPVPQGFQTTTIEYKQFGVGLSFTPTVLSGGKINMEVAPEVSELDFSTAVTLSGFVVPGLTTRKVSTTVELADGQSFAIAGLLRDDVRDLAQKFPLLGDIPILGTLFRSTSFQKNETELVIIVTPHLVKPLDMAKQTLPTDQFVEPDEFNFYLNGQLEGRGEPQKRSLKPVPAKPEGKAGLEGEFGHILPQ